MSKLEFRILGPLEVLRDVTPLDLGPPRQRAVLVALLLRYNRVVATGQLLEELWGGDSSSGSRHSLQVHVANLRKVLEPDAGRGENRLLVTKAPGYAMMIEPDTLDSAVFEQLTTEARAHAAVGDAETTARLLRAALGLWRGSALADVALEEFATRDADRLEEARIVATEDLIDAELALHRHFTLVGEIEQLVNIHPLRERLWAQLMLALYRSGRQAEALRAYERLRTTLRDELGVEPSRELRDLETAVLEQSPQLDLEPPPATTQPSFLGPAAAKEPIKRRRPWPLVVTGVAVALVLALVAVAFVSRRESNAHVALAGAAAYAPRTRPRPCPSDFHAAAPNGTCGELLVPQDRAKPSGRWLALPYETAPARSVGDRAPDPTVAIGEFGALEDPATSPARDHSDLILFGTRTSEAADPAMECPEYDRDSAAFLAGSLRDRALQRRVPGDLRRCYTRLTTAGVDFSHYTLLDGGDDVVDLIRALHLPHVNLAAADIDVPSAFEVVRSAPQVVRTLTLDNPIPPGTAGPLDLVAQLARAFDQYEALCRADAACARAYPDPERTVTDALRGADQHPITVDITEYGRRDKVRVDRDHATRAIAAALADPTEVGYINAAAAAPPTQSVANLTAETEASNDYFWFTPHFPMSIFLSKRCGYTAQNEIPGRSLSIASRPEFSGFDDDLLQLACAGWPVPKGPDALFAPVQSAVPTFIIQGDLTWWSTPQNTAKMQAGLPNSSLLLFPTLGAGRQGLSLIRDGVPPCLNGLRKTFLAHPSQRLDTADCTRQSPPIAFVTALK
jgi:DNA-binding SARP family transcriptional activator/pimeloyl-ACP methyl ester carboxylesterase